ncbi:MAG: DUF4445 domain-containing protein, partial [Deltaproteobacteria bacterium]|nr:DUF4445 domain-containing protein [Deltaproteobacteria bacterium]
MPKLVKITLAPGRQSIQVPMGTDLKEVLHRFGVEFPCGGRGRCGACRIKLIEGELPVTQACADTLSQEETEAGWRFSCRHRADQDLTFELGQREALVLTEHGSFQIEVQEGTAIVVDLGTTTLVAQLIDLESGQVLAVETALNPQAVHGGDLMTRIDFGLSEDGRVTLMQSIREKLGELIQGLLSFAPSSIAVPGRILLAGNTVMHHLFCGLKLTALSSPPFESLELGSRRFAARELGWEIIGDPEVTFLPCLGGFVGSDILAGILATGMHLSENLIGLADLGTNGEIVIGNRHGIFCASTAAGPAFEAGGIEMGMRAATGAIVEVEVHQEEVSCQVLGGGQAQGICGSGLVDAVAAGLALGRLEPSGRLLEEHRPFQLSGRVAITQHDVRQLQLAKGAIAAGIRILLKNAKAEPADLSEFYLAGAFGNYVKSDSARRVGLLPFSKEQIQAAGNTSLHGLKTLIFSKDNYDFDALTKKVEHVPLASDDEFQKLFVM